jgi:hypothetical protein
MSLYRGDVTVTADGVGYPATADLLSWAEQRPGGAPPIEGAADWNGRLEVADESVADIVAHAAECRLWMPDGRVSDFVVSRRSFDVGLLVIEGVGEPPF